MLERVLYNPQRPLAAVMGGAKVSDKIRILHNLTERVDLLLIGGGMVATFYKALGYPVGDSLIEEECVGFTDRVMRDAQAQGVPLLLPEDLVVAQETKDDAAAKTVSARRVPEGWRILDIGPKTVEHYREALRRCRTVFWNGPMGVFEHPAFARGTKGLAEAIAGLKDACTVVGGGSTVEAVTALGLEDRITHVSTGGGASLEFLEGRDLPGVEALQRKDEEKP